MSNVSKNSHIQTRQTPIAKRQNRKSLKRERVEMRDLSYSPDKVKQTKVQEYQKQRKSYTQYEEDQAPSFEDYEIHKHYHNYHLKNRQKNDSLIEESIDSYSSERNFKGHSPALSPIRKSKQEESQMSFFPLIPEKQEGMGSYQNRRIEKKKQAWKRRDSGDYYTQKERSEQQFGVSFEKKNI